MTLTFAGFRLTERFLAALAILAFLSLLVGCSSLSGIPASEKEEQDRIAAENDLNARSDLDRVAYAQAAFLAEHDAYSNNASTLFEYADAFTPTTGNPITILSNGSKGWVAVTKSASGQKYVRTSAGSAVLEANQAGTGDTATVTYVGYAFNLPPGFTETQVRDAVVAIP